MNNKRRLEKIERQLAASASDAPLTWREFCDMGRGIIPQDDRYSEAWAAVIAANIALDERNRRKRGEA